jgi:hypothetical protein
VATLKTYECTRKFKINLSGTGQNDRVDVDGSGSGSCQNSCFCLPDMRAIRFALLLSRKNSGALHKAPGLLNIDE